MTKKKETTPNTSRTRTGMAKPRTKAGKKLPLPLRSDETGPPIGDTVCIELLAERPDGFGWLALDNGKIVIIPGTKPDPIGTGTGTN